MMLKTNFTKPYGELISIAGILLFSISCVLIYSSISKYLQMSEFEQQFEKIQLDTVKYQEHIKQLNIESITKPSESLVKKLSIHIKQQAELASELQSSALTLLDNLEVLLPKTVYLTLLDFDVASSKVKIIAISDDISGMSTFLTALEKDSAYSNVLLRRQSTVQVNSKDKVEFELLITERDS